MASVTLNIEVPKSRADTLAQVKNKKDLELLARSLANGILTGDTCDLYASDSNLVAAAGTATITYASIAATDTLVIGQTTFTCVASGANGTTTFNKVTDATATAASLVTAINGNSTTSKYCVASNVAGVVTITMRFKGSLGNAIVIQKTGTGIAVVQPTGGTGGPESAPQAVGA